MILLLLAVFCGTAAAETAAEPAAEPAAEKAAWTVMIYLCGSDLESQYSFATGNLQEIAAVHEPENQIGTILTDVRDISDLQVKLPGQVHILLETGGSSEWHAQALGEHSAHRAPAAAHFAVNRYDIVLVHVYLHSFCFFDFTI